MDAAILQNMRNSMAQARIKLDAMKTELDKAKLAGFDVAQAEKDYSELKTRLLKMATVYGS